MPDDSNWKTASVLPSANTARALASLSAISGHLISSPSICLMLIKQSFITVKAVSAKKSILSMPVFSRSDITYCVVSSSLPETATGINSWSGSGEITTPAATTDRRRDHLRNPVDLGIRHLKRPAHVFNRGLRGEGPKRDDLADRVATVE